ncbi:MAG: YbhB/YbcL family Raf kinase inhibitor-like protein [Pyrinomonadaceae bacterium]
MRSVRAVSMGVARGVALSLLTLGSAALLRGQDKQTTDVRIEGHVYEPAKLEPDAARVRQLRLPEGFRVAKFAEVSNPRMLAVGTDGTVYVSQREPGTLTMLRDTNGDGVADVQRVVVEKPMLHGVAIHGGRMYLATVREVFVADIRPDGTLGPLRQIISDLPDGGQHPNRTLAVGPDGMLYVSVGSTCNACDETNEEAATIVRANLDGRGRKIFASGLRNTIGFGWHPASRKMYGMDHGIDWLGNDDQKEELNELIEGARYGWPYVYADSKLNPQDEVPKKLGLTNADWARMSKEPLLLYTAHSAPLQMAFYTGAMFPAEYRNDAFVAMRGSWNRKPPSGYEVVRVRFDQQGRPTRIEPFLTGFLVKGGGPEGKDGHFARLAGVGVARDGALLVADDTNNVIYRVSYGQGTTQEDITARASVTSLMPEVQRAPASISVRSDAFGPNQPIPDRHSAYHEDRSPALSWTNVPASAKSLVLLVEDPDAGSPMPFAHWLVVNIPANAQSLAAALPKSETLAQAGGAMQQGATHTGKLGYYGPRPPAGDPPHRYHFQVFALDRMLQLPTGFNRQALLDAMRGHVVARGELVGTYQRVPKPGEMTGAGRR